MEIEQKNPVRGQKKGAVNSRNETQTEFTQFTTRYDSETSAIWCWMHPEPRPCLNSTLINEVEALQRQLSNIYNTQHSDTVWPFRHLILASKTPGIYNL